VGKELRPQTAWGGLLIERRAAVKGVTLHDFSSPEPKRYLVERPAKSDQSLYLITAYRKRVGR